MARRPKSHAVTSSSKHSRAMRLLRATAVVGVFSALTSLVEERASEASPIGALRAQKVYEAVHRLDLDEAKKTLSGVPLDDPQVARARALVAIYEGDFDLASDILARPSVAADEGAQLAELARGSARCTAGTQVVSDPRGVTVRIKDEDDAALVPYVVDVTLKSLTALERDLGVQLPKPVRIELVRDHYSLAAMTGLPEKAAQTTGTIAIAKWGRVTMLSPRAMAHGFPWADSLMHELTHLAVTRASADRAPLWLQEGVAKREEMLWREAMPFDAQQSPDAQALLGFRKNLAIPLDALGPSLAMLPSADQAAVAYAEVQSFVGYWITQNGADALPRLLTTLATEPGQDAVDAAMRSVSKLSLKEWSDRWRAWLETAVPQSAQLDSPHAGDDVKNIRELSRQSRLGELLLSRSHVEQATPYTQRALELSPKDPSSRVRHARAMHALDRWADVTKAVGTIDTLSAPSGLWFSYQGAVIRNNDKQTQGVFQAFERALWFDPLTEEVACELLAAPVSPTDALREALCGAVRHSHQN